MSKKFSHGNYNWITKNQDGRSNDNYNNTNHELYMDRYYRDNLSKYRWINQTLMPMTPYAHQMMMRQSFRPQFKLKNKNNFKSANRNMISNKSLLSKPSSTVISKQQKSLESLEPNLVQVKSADQIEMERLKKVEEDKARLSKLLNKTCTLASNTLLTSAHDFLSSSSSDKVNEESSKNWEHCLSLPTVELTVNDYCQIGSLVGNRYVGDELDDSLNKNDDSSSDDTDSDNNDDDCKIIEVPHETIVLEDDFDISVSKGNQESLVSSLDKSKFENTLIKHSKIFGDQNQQSENNSLNSSHSLNLTKHSNIELGKNCNENESSPLFNSQLDCSKDGNSENLLPTNLELGSENLETKNRSIINVQSKEEIIGFTERKPVACSSSSIINKPMLQANIARMYISFLKYRKYYTASRKGKHQKDTDHAYVNSPYLNKSHLQINNLSNKSDDVKEYPDLEIEQIDRPNTCHSTSSKSIKNIDNENFVDKDNTEEKEEADEFMINYGHLLDDNFTIPNEVLQQLGINDFLNEFQEFELPAKEINISMTDNSPEVVDNNSFNLLAENNEFNDRANKCFNKKSAENQTIINYAEQVLPDSILIDNDKFISSKSELNSLCIEKEINTSFDVQLKKSYNTIPSEQSGFSIKDKRENRIPKESIEDKKSSQKHTNIFEVVSAKSINDIKKSINTGFDVQLKQLDNSSPLKHSGFNIKDTEENYIPKLSVEYKRTTQENADKFEVVSAKSVKDIEKRISMDFETPKMNSNFCESSILKPEIPSNAGSSYEVNSLQNASFNKISSKYKNRKHNFLTCVKKEVIIDPNGSSINENESLSYMSNFNKTYPISKMDKKKNKQKRKQINFGGLTNVVSVENQKHVNFNVGPIPVKKAIYQDIKVKFVDLLYAGVLRSFLGQKVLRETLEREKYLFNGYACHLNGIDFLNCIVKAVMNIHGNYKGIELGTILLESFLFLINIICQIPNETFAKMLNLIHFIIVSNINTFQNVTRNNVLISHQNDLNEMETSSAQYFDASHNIVNNGSVEQIETSVNDLDTSKNLNENRSERFSGNDVNSSQNHPVNYQESNQIYNTVNKSEIGMNNSLHLVNAPSSESKTCEPKHVKSNIETEMTSNAEMIDNVDNFFDVLTIIDEKIDSLTKLKLEIYKEIKKNKLSGDDLNSKDSLSNCLEKYVKLISLPNNKTTVNETYDVKPQCMLQESEHIEVKNEKTQQSIHEKTVVELRNEVHKTLLKNPDYLQTRKKSDFGTINELQLTSNNKTQQRVSINTEYVEAKNETQQSQLKNTDIEADLENRTPCLNLENSQERNMPRYVHKKSVAKNLELLEFDSKCFKSKIPEYSASNLPESSSSTEQKDIECIEVIDTSEPTSSDILYTPNYVKPLASQQTIIINDENGSAECVIEHDINKSASVKRFASSIDEVPAKRIRKTSDSVTNTLRNNVDFVDLVNDSVSNDDDVKIIKINKSINSFPMEPVINHDSFIHSIWTKDIQVLVIKACQNDLFLGCQDGSVLWIKPRILYHKFTAHQNAIGSLLFHKRFLFSGSADGSLIVHRLNHTKKRVLSIPIAEPIQVMVIKYLTLFIGSKEGKIYQFNLKTMKLTNKKFVVGGQNDSVFDILVSKEGPRHVLIAAVKNQPLTIRDIDTGLLLRNVNFDDIFYNLGFSGYTSYVYCATRNHSVVVVDFTSGEPVKTLNLGRNVIKLITKWDVIFTASYDGYVHIYNLKTQEMYGKYSVKGLIIEMALWNNKILLSTSNNGPIKINFPKSLTKHLSLTK